MASEKRLRANRSNAKKGGVKTKEGKSVSRLNATKHGIFSSVVIGGMEDDQVLNQIRKQAFDDLKPKGFLEVILTDRIVVYTFRLRRCAIADKAMMERENLDVYRLNAKESKLDLDLRCELGVINNGRTELLFRYETTIEGRLYKAMRELRELQKIRLDSENNTCP
jgi:hypothetical protein